MNVTPIGPYLITRVVIRGNFFFQAEDGIRGIGVTGVQTCALPISIDSAEYGFQSMGDVAFVLVPKIGFTNHTRSEERRVGKECRSRWSPYPRTKKTTL